MVTEDWVLSVVETGADRIRRELDTRSGRALALAARWSGILCTGWQPVYPRAIAERWHGLAQRVCWVLEV